MSLAGWVVLILSSFSTPGLSDFSALLLNTNTDTSGDFRILLVLEFHDHVVNLAKISKIDPLNQLLIGQSPRRSPL